MQLHLYPIRDLGGVKNANSDAAVNLEVEDRVAAVRFYCTAAHSDATVRLWARGRVLMAEKTAISPERSYTKRVPLPTGIGEHDLRASLSVRGKELIAYSPVRLQAKAAPKPVVAPPSPMKVKTNEELYMIGLRAEQFHDPRIRPESYWEEALRRDPGDAQVNTALGLKRLKEARFREAESHFARAIRRITQNYTTPKSGEAFYYLGVAQQAQGRLGESLSNFHKATWDWAWRGAAYYALAEAACQRGEFARALELIDCSIDVNSRNLRALNLKAAVLRHLGRRKSVLDLLTVVARVSDPLDVRSLSERWLTTKSAADEMLLASTMDAHPHTADEAAAEYLNAGLFGDGTEVLLRAIAKSRVELGKRPVLYYYLGYFAKRLGQAAKSREYYRLAAGMPADYVFPFQVELIEVFRDAMAASPRDARAPYYLGNLLFDWQPDEAVKMWTLSAALDPSFPVVQRNLRMAASQRASIRGSNGK